MDQDYLIELNWLVFSFIQIIAEALGTLDYPIVVELYVHDAIRLDGLNRHSFEVDWHTAFQLIRTHIQDLDTLGERDIRMVMLIEDGKTVVPINMRPCELVRDRCIGKRRRRVWTKDILSVAVSSIRELGKCSKVIEPVKRRLPGDWVNAAHQEVDVVWFPRS